jgi:hypothetical protein
MWYRSLGNRIRAQCEEGEDQNEGCHRLSASSVRGVRFGATLYLVCPVQSLFDFDTALSRFKENIEALFAGIRVDRYGQIAFYPSHFRNVIMEAANNLTAGYYL